jgi:hypothetical protein
MGTPLSEAKRNKLQMGCLSAENLFQMGCLSAENLKEERKGPSSRAYHPLELIYS